MPQENQVLRCFSCKMFQVHLVKKVKKWECKVCHSKQSVKQIYGKGSGKDCRDHVMKLNKYQFSENEGVHFPDNTEPEQENSTHSLTRDSLKCQKQKKASKWSAFTDEVGERESLDDEIECEASSIHDNYLFKKRGTNIRKCEDNQNFNPTENSQRLTNCFGEDILQETKVNIIQGDNVLGNEDIRNVRIAQSKSHTSKISLSRKECISGKSKWTAYVGKEAGGGSSSDDTRDMANPVKRHKETTVPLVTEDVNPNHLPIAGNLTPSNKVSTVTSLSGDSSGHSALTVGKKPYREHHPLEILNKRSEKEDHFQIYQTEEEDLDNILRF